jgi:hypothetical protein
VAPDASGVVGSPAKVYRNVAAVHPSEFLKSISKGSNATLTDAIILSKAHKHADAPHPLALLRGRRYRPRRHTAKFCNELAALHSIISSAKM